MQYRRRVLQGFQSLVSYSWSHSLDNDSSDAFADVGGRRRRARARDHASSDFDLRHSLTAAVTYEFPVRPAGIGRWLGGWAIDSLVRARSGFPISVLVNEQYQGIALANAFRPDRLLGSAHLDRRSSAPGGKRLNRGGISGRQRRDAGHAGPQLHPGLRHGAGGSGAAPRVPCQGSQGAFRCAWKRSTS